MHQTPHHPSLISYTTKVENSSIDEHTTNSTLTSSSSLSIVHRLSQQLGSSNKQYKPEHVNLGMTYFEAIYFIVITMSTVEKEKLHLFKKICIHNMITIVEFVN